MIKASTPVAIAIVIVCGAGCSSSDGPSSLPECQVAVTVTVGGGTAPAFTWSPQCRAGMIIVDPLSDAVSYWVLHADADTNGLHPPITYGTSPAGSVTIVQPVPLQAGGAYRVRVYRATGDNGHPFEGIGAAPFTP